MKITAEKGKQNKIHISCDGEYIFTVDAEYWFSSPYYGKDNIDDEEELAAFYEAVGSRCAFIAGLRLLSYSDHSAKNLVTKLVQKGHKREYSENAVEKLKEYGYVNDERYAQYLAESLLERKGMNIRAIKFELMHKGISKQIADNVTESLDFDPILRIIDLLNTKYSRKISDEKGVKRTVASLMRLGYSWSDINSAFRRLEIETEDIDNV
ncbi:MAG: regulatory protein RecX [Ruminococcaceae bacterium]|nr:regulatory protein RecX [Oscillospiraceae bacterium]